MVQQVIECIKLAVPQYDMLLTQVVQTWIDLVEDPEKVEIQAQMEEVQRQHERLKLTLKALIPIEKMQRDQDSKVLKKQYNSLKEKEESLAVRLDPLQEAAMNLTQVMEGKKRELTMILKEKKAKIEEPMSGQRVEEV